MAEKEDQNEKVKAKHKRNLENKKKETKKENEKVRAKQNLKKIEK